MLIDPFLVAYSIDLLSYIPPKFYYLPRSLSKHFVLATVALTNLIYMSACTPI